jgi:hypothetical protein
MSADQTCAYLVSSSASIEKMGSDAALDKRLRFRYGTLHRMTRDCTRYSALRA